MLNIYDSRPPPAPSHTYRGSNEHEPALPGTAPHYPSATHTCINPFYPSTNGTNIHSICTTTPQSSSPPHKTYHSPYYERTPSDATQNHLNCAYLLSYLIRIRPSHCNLLSFFLFDSHCTLDSWSILHLYFVTEP